jgi:hypothetical protein
LTSSRSHGQNLLHYAPLRGDIPLIKKILSHISSLGGAVVSSLSVAGSRVGLVGSEPEKRKELGRGVRRVRRDDKENKRMRRKKRKKKKKKKNWKIGKQNREGLMMRVQLTHWMRRKREN